METGSVTNLDIISNLPTDVKDAILMRLSITDAVSTSVLSSKWRYSWASIPQLVFDKDCIQSYIEEEHIHNYRVKLVDRVLLLHNGAIHKFKLSKYVQSCSNIDQWILYLSRTGIKKLVLEFWPKNRYKVPTCLFSCQELSHLELRHCVLKPMTFKRLGSLRSLHLENVVCCEEIIQRLIASCPLLERLTLLELDGPTCLKIQAPNLRYLNLSGVLEDVCFENMPLLTILRVHMPRSNKDKKYLEQGRSCNLVKVLGCLESVERIDVAGYFQEFLAAGRVPERLPTTYHNLKNLHLDANFEDLNETLTVLCLLRSSSSLQTLKIQAYSTKEEATISVGNFWKEQKPSDCSLNQLQVVRMTGILGIKSELEFIRFVLANAPALVTMGVKIDPKMTSEEARTFRELMRFRRASAQAEIVCLD
ncbi:F-box/FBD/LRR-repeat protein At1g13570-like [Tasmannia lanceolata]|uniref:F-box/FBD/LRR-repeat protein At1g13570-like n=1 Tax=Tasmannia lanceolata TaxID=3420 RepID=UPI004062ECA6